MKIQESTLRTQPQPPERLCTFWPQFRQAEEKTVGIKHIIVHCYHFLISTKPMLQAENCDTPTNSLAALVNFTVYMQFSVQCLTAQYFRGFWFQERFGGKYGGFLNFENILNERNELKLKKEEESIRPSIAKLKHIKCFKKKMSDESTSTSLSRLGNTL